MSSGSELAVQIPQHITTLMGKEEFKSDFGKISPRDVRAPFIKIAHGNSPFCKPGWGPNGNEQPMPYGTMFMTHNYKVLPIGVHFIVLLRDTCYIKWLDGKPGTRMLGFTKNENDPMIVKENGLAFREQNGKTLPPIWDTYMNFYVVTPYNMDQPVVLSFYRTALAISRKFLNHILQATQFMQMPIFSHKYKLSWKEAGPDTQGNTWAQFQYTPDGFVTEDIMKQCIPLVDKARMLSMVSDSVEFAAELADQGVATRDAEGEVVSETQTPKTAPPPPQAPSFGQQEPTVQTPPPQAPAQQAAQAAPAQTAQAAQPVQTAPTQPVQPAQPAQTAQGGPQSSPPQVQLW